jgi:glycosyltransferase involved in cell wall biosynthesis
MSELAARLEGVRVEFGIPSYNEGRGLLHTLRSLREAAIECGLEEPHIILSDSSETSATVDAAIEWARDSGVKLSIDRSPKRRSLKHARNVLMDSARAELLIQIDADVVTTAAGLSAMLSCLTGPAHPQVAIGSVLPDPDYSQPQHRAAAWQLKMVHRIASRQPHDYVRSEGAFWGAWRTFYSTYRFPVGRGSIHDDVELARHLQDHQVATANCWRAVAYKVPAGTRRDFFLQTHRFRSAVGSSWSPFPRDLVARAVTAAAIEGALDPLRALQYIRARVWSRRYTHMQELPFDEEWEVAASTKRPP